MFDLIKKKKCRSGEIGRRSGFKILRVNARAGSSPAFGTIIIINLLGEIQKNIAIYLDYFYFALILLRQHVNNEMCP